MNNQFKKVVFLLSIVIYAVVGLAQQTFTSIPVNNNTLHYEGRMDDINKVKMTLNCIGATCTGEFIYPKSGDRFSLKGTSKNNQFQLEEYDRDNQLTGYIRGKTVGNTIEANWENVDRSIGSTIVVQQVSAQNRDYGDCGDNKWIHAYSGQIDGKEVELMLHKLDNYRLIGTAHFLKENIKHSVQGKLTANNNLVIDIFHRDNQVNLGSIRAIYKNEQELNASFYRPNNSQSFATFQLAGHMEMTCLEYADYYSSYDLLYPKSQDPLFDQIMSFLVKDWIKECKNVSTSTRQQPVQPELRARQRGYAWTEATFFKDHFLSGLLTFHSTWGTTKVTKAFNYDFANRASIELEDIFKRKFEYTTYIKDYIQTTLSADSNYRYNSDYKSWMDGQQFHLFTISSEGLVFFTDFHPIYGRKSIVLPYKKIKGNLKKKNPIQRFF